MDMSQSVEDWLVKKGWPFDSLRKQSRTTFETEVSMEHGPVKLQLYTDERQRFFGAYAFAPFKIAPEHCRDILEIIARSNWGHVFARFELEPDTGEFRCSSYTVLPNSKLSAEMIETMAIFVVGWIDPLLPTLEQMAISH